MKWITREKARVDRIACPWLISRFVDPSPTFLFVPPGDVLATAAREGAIPFDVPDVELGHHGDRCSFDAFLDRYELDDPALGRLALIVRGADTSRHDLAPEAAGLYAAASGFRAISRDDHENLARQFPLYDALYAHCSSQGGAAGQAPKILFACRQGAAESVVARALLERLAAAHGLDVRAVAAGLEPASEVTPAARAGLLADGLPAPRPPRPVTLHDLASASVVVSFGCEVPGARARVRERWDDVPPVSEGYAAARDAIRARLPGLIQRLDAPA